MVVEFENKLKSDPEDVLTEVVDLGDIVEGIVDAITCLDSGKIIPPPTSEPSYLEGESEFELVVEDEGGEEFIEEFEEEEEEDDLEYFDTFFTREELEYHEWLLKNPRPS
ncbi:hypothetical protein Tco_0295125 [Tanacetum coccineum]